MSNNNNIPLGNTITSGDLNSTNGLDITRLYQQTTLAVTEKEESNNRTVILVVATIFGIIIIVLISVGVISACWFCQKRKKRIANCKNMKYVHNNLSQNNLTPKQRRTRRDKEKLEKMDNISMDSYRSDLDTIIEETSKTVSASSSQSELNENSTREVKPSNIRTDKQEEHFKDDKKDISTVTNGKISQPVVNTKLLPVSTGSTQSLDRLIARFEPKTNYDSRNNSSTTLPKKLDCKN